MMNILMNDSNILSNTITKRWWKRWKYHEIPLITTWPILYIATTLDMLQVFYRISGPNTGELGDLLIVLPTSYEQLANRVLSVESTDHYTIIPNYSWKSTCCCGLHPINIWLETLKHQPSPGHWTARSSPWLKTLSRRESLKAQVARLPSDNQTGDPQTKWRF